MSGRCRSRSIRDLGSQHGLDFCGVVAKGFETVLKKVA